MKKALSIILIISVFLIIRHAYIQITEGINEKKEQDLFYNELKTRVALCGNSILNNKYSILDYEYANPIVHEGLNTELYLEINDGYLDQVYEVYRSCYPIEKVRNKIPIVNFDPYLEVDANARVMREFCINYISDNENVRTEMKEKCGEAFLDLQTSLKHLE